jgi:hypothetical protein
MTRASRRFETKPTLAVAVAIGMALTLPQLAWCQDTAKIEGQILDITGNPLVGYQAVWLVVGTEQEFTSAPSSSNGAYAVMVPVGSTFRIRHVLGPNGGEFEILQTGLVTAERATTTTLDIVMELAEADRGLSGGAIAGIVVGSVLGGTLLLYLLGGGDSNDPDITEPPASLF